MNPRTALWVPVLLGGATGALLAIAAGRSQVEERPAARESAVSAQQAVQAPGAALAVAPSASVTGANTVDTGPRGSGTAPPSAAPQAPTAAAPPPVAASGAPGSAAIDLAPPTTRETLVAAEVRCNGKSPEDCERAARALEAGSVVPRDPGRASVLKRIALTLYVKQCESARALACARLAEMYAAGEYVQKNPRGAEALRARVRSLCGQKPAQPGCAP